MEKKRTVQRISNKKRGRPKVRFNFMVIVIIAALTFTACFILYMVRANISGNALDDNYSKTTVVVQNNTISSASGEAGAGEQVRDKESTTAADQISYPVPQSAAEDKTYFDICCLISDSTLLDMGKNTKFTDVLGNAQLGAANCGDTKLSSSYGDIDVYQTIKLKKPKILYIMLGSDIGVSKIEDMVSSYTSLVSNLHNIMPEMKIYVMQLPPVAADTDTVTNALINAYNSRIMDMAKNLGVYCIDTNTALKSADGTLDKDYWSESSGTLSKKGYSSVSDYILTHTVK